MIEITRGWLRLMLKDGSCGTGFVSAAGIARRLRCEDHPEDARVEDNCESF